MIVLFDFCSIPWWLTWILPFLLGLGIGWLIWSKWKDIAIQHENKIKQLESSILEISGELDACKKTRMEAEGNVALLRGRIREIEASQGKATSAKPVQKSKSAKSPQIKAGLVGSTGGSPTDRIFALIGSSNFQIIEGIGPKMEEVLKENGFSNLESIALKSGEELRVVLDKYGDKYRIIDPNTWPHQASLANDKKWDDLIALQKSLNGGGSDGSGDGDTPSKFEKLLIKAKILNK